jgi:pimeloyl-ACP methyl ester carboxylesterase
MTRVVALHGVPTSPRLWSRLDVGVPVVAPALAGLATDEPRSRWDLDGWLDAVRPMLDADTVLVGHDLGGLLATILAVQVPVRALVLSATSLSPLFAAGLRWSAAPLLWRYFYRRHGGRRFLTGGLPDALRQEVIDTFLASAPRDLPERMRSTASALRIPHDLEERLRDTSVRVSLVWGRRDPWYPLPLARGLARRIGADWTVLDAGHLAPWEAPGAYSAAVAAVCPGSTGRG